MDLYTLKNTIGGIDIYLLDQILKERYSNKDIILDAGCGSGRNLKWFYKNGFTIYGIDKNSTGIDIVKDKYKGQKEHFSVQNLDSLNFKDEKFDHVVCNAVLHFAQNYQHFKKMFSELVRVVRKDGTIFIRIATIKGIEEHVTLISDGIYKLTDNTNRFLLTDNLLNEIKNEFNLQLLEPFKYVYVANIRSMATLVLRKR
jgi:tellurite methyltransferase